ncbi:hypothetical protein F5X68DRAFT_8010 [Plectosphaerella plurivora]|uniref:Uncharacterized protein n=1 Tax=Plectosphaerella plurivora TaxID=936078 RepID=A0A9P8VBE5_9PEZI|nr:hypothetical protein F5X68DRAFT_8010 [Plectosphaerella plurivora]
MDDASELRIVRWTDRQLIPDVSGSSLFCLLHWRQPISWSRSNTGGGACCLGPGHRQKNRRPLMLSARHNELIRGPTGDMVAHALQPAKSVIRRHSARAQSLQLARRSSPTWPGHLSFISPPGSSFLYMRLRAPVHAVQSTAGCSPSHDDDAWLLQLPCNGQPGAGDMIMWGSLPYHSTKPGSQMSDLLLFQGSSRPGNQGWGLCMVVEWSASSFDGRSGLVLLQLN